ncbi:hypothetical protein ABN034_04255 [Actinopolymorpha sp. B11F2]
MAETSFRPTMFQALDSLVEGEKDDDADLLFDLAAGGGARRLIRDC